MNDLRVASNNVLANSDKALKKQKEQQAKKEHKHQLVVKHQNKLNAIKDQNNEHLPDEFSSFMRTVHKNKQIVVDASSKNYRVAKQLTKLFWIRAIKNKGTQVTFQETKLGKQIMDKIKPSKDLSNLFLGIDLTQIVSSILLGSADFILLLAGGITPSESYTNMVNFIFEIAVAILLSTFITFGINFVYDKYRNYLTVGNCTKIAKKILNKHDIAFEHQYLIKYSKDNR